MKVSLLIVSGIAGLVAHTQVAAQSGAELVPESLENPAKLEQIIVTAQKRTEQLQDVPISIASVDGARIDDLGITKLDEFQSYVPSLTVTETGIGSLLFIRGIGSGINQGFEQSVGTYVDGVYRGRAQQSRLPFLDLERIEVLRGSQSILFGKHTIAGALNLTTARPTNTFMASVSTLYEPGTNGEQIRAYISGPLGEHVNGRLAVHSRETDGWMRNLTLGREEAQRNEQVIRATLDWQVGSDLDLTFKAESSRFDVEGRQLEIIEDRNALGGPFAGMNYAAVAQVFGQDASVTNNVLDFNRSANGDYSYNSAEEFVVTGNYYGLGDLTMTSITAFSQYGYDELCDCDYTGADVFSAMFAELYQQFSQEIRFVSPGDQDFDYLFGLSYHNSNLEFFDTIRISPDSLLVPMIDAQVGQGAGRVFAGTSTPRNLDQQTNIAALFGQAQWYLSPVTKLSLGGRLTHERKLATRSLSITDTEYRELPVNVAPLAESIYGGLFNISNHGIVGERHRTRLLPSLTLQHYMNDQVMAYLTMSRGEKSGGFDARSNNGPVNGGSFEFNDELADTIEIGTKMTLANGSVELNTALYYTRFDDMQVSTFDGVLGFNVGNAARAITKGIEIDGRYRVNNRLTLSGSVIFSDFEFKEYFGQCYFGQDPDAPDGINCDYKGRRNQFQADYSGRLSAEYRRPVASAFWLDATFDALFTDSYLLTSTQDPRALQSAYIKFNGRVALSSPDERWELALLLRNLTDVRVKSFGGDVPMAGSRFGTPGLYAFVEQGRSLAIQAEFRY